MHAHEPLELGLGDGLPADVRLLPREVEGLGAHLLLHYYAFMCAVIGMVWFGQPVGQSAIWSVGLIGRSAD